MSVKKPFHLVLGDRDREIIEAISSNEKCSVAEAVRRCIRAVGTAGAAVAPMMKPTERAASRKPRSAAV